MNSDLPTTSHCTSLMNLTCLPVRSYDPVLGGRSQNKENDDIIGANLPGGVVQQATTVMCPELFVSREEPPSIYHVLDEGIQLSTQTRI
jgi:hypothetical protein